ncbi:transcription factor kayak [Aspergillus udagawae]|nr:transcription factor kayak [Aspergillus udagawae]GFG21241.1 transcription factor kayak [Aspergillus udagawae]
MEDPNGWEIYASQKQLNRSNWRSVAASLGRQLSTTPEHLSRVLYIPRHDGTTSHLPLYDVSSQYFEAIGDAPIGSSKYAVCLGMMKRPRGDGTDHVPVAYIVNFTAGDKDKVVGTVEYRVQPDSTVTENAEVELYVSRQSQYNTHIANALRTIGNADEEACSIKFNSDGAQRIDPVAVGVSYPIPPSVTKVGTVKHPYFHFRMPFESKMAQFEWQVHPVEHGPLRYTLVRMPGEETTDESSAEPEADVHAIYHHIGLGVSMSVPHSEGVLLLPPCTDPKSEAIIVASVLGMLRRVRGLDGEKGKKEAKHHRFGSVRKILKRGN